MYTKAEQEKLAKKAKAVVYSVVPEEVLTNKRAITRAEYDKALKTCQAMYKYVRLFSENTNIDISLRNQVDSRKNKAAELLMYLALEERRSGLRKCGFILVD